MIENFQLQAMAKVTASASGAGVAPTFALNNGFNAATSVHTAVGVYGLDLDQPVDATESIILATISGAAADQHVTGVVDTDDTRKTITVGLGAGVASDAVSFCVGVWRRPGS